MTHRELIDKANALRKRCAILHGIADELRRTAREVVKESRERRQALANVSHMKNHRSG